jgi:DnaK suppressor protein
MTGNSNQDGTRMVADGNPGRKPMPKKAATQKAVQVEQRHSALDGFRTYTPYVEKAGEEYMNPKQAEHFRGILIAWRKELMEEVDRTVHHMQDEAANFPDPNDRATQESEFSMELRTRDRERKLLKKIDEALQALDNEEYGYCESCGVEIGIRRLEARPTATLCIDCKTLDEIREKQRG